MCKISSSSRFISHTSCKFLNQLHRVLWLLFLCCWWRLLLFWCCCGCCCCWLLFVAKWPLTESFFRLSRASFRLEMVVFWLEHCYNRHKTKYYEPSLTLIESIILLFTSSSNWFLWLVTAFNSSRNGFDPRVRFNSTTSLSKCNFSTSRSSIRLLWFLIEFSRSIICKAMDQLNNY